MPVNIFLQTVLESSLKDQLQVVKTFRKFDQLEKFRTFQKNAQLVQILNKVFIREVAAVYKLYDILGIGEHLNELQVLAHLLVGQEQVIDPEVILR